MAPRAEDPSAFAALDRAASLRRQGRWDEALAAFRRIWTQTPTGPDKTAALAYGHMALLSGHPEAALGPLREAADSQSPLAPYGQLLLARALLDLGEAEEAGKLAKRWTQAPSLRFRFQALSLLARSQQARGQITPRLETLARLASLSSGPVRDRLVLEKARSLLTVGRGREAERILWELYLRPSCVVGREAGLLLRDRAAEGGPREPALDAAGRMALARRFLKAGRREDAWDCLQELPDGAFEGALGEAAALLRVEVLHALRRNAETVRAAEALAASRGETEAALRARLKAVWALVREGDHGAVAEQCRSLLDLSAKGHEGLRAEALHAWAVSAYASGLFEEAAQTWAALAAEGDPEGRAPSAPYLHGWATYKGGHSNKALLLFRSLAEPPPDANLHGGILWGLASAARRAGAEEEERNALLRLAASPDAYWRAAALKRLQETGLHLSPEPPVRLSPAWSGRAGEADGALARALDRAGLKAEAAEAFAPVFRKAGTRPEVAYTYALLCGRAGRRAAALSALRRAAPNLSGPWALPDEALDALYPSPQVGRIRRAAEAEGVPTALVLAVMLQESGFDEQALSPAGARGLMQILPETAARLRREGEAEADLFDPDVNADLGIRYLGRLLHRFPTAGAVAAYNAGEEVVARWIASWKPEGEEEFVAMIPYAETRAYTARVLDYVRDYARRLRRDGKERGKG